MIIFSQKLTLLRLLDFFIALLVLSLLSPILLFSMLCVYACDFHSPLYISVRVGRRGVPFKMVKLRSMTVSDNLGFQSTSGLDPRITPVGRFFRSLKIDELFQFINVLNGSMSIVGPRPNVLRDVALYNQYERKLLTVLPGITDFSSIVFSDESQILAPYQNPDDAYNSLIRPWKSRLAMIYLLRPGIASYLFLILLTFICLFNRSVALSLIAIFLRRINALPSVVEVAMRKSSLELMPSSPPTSDSDIVCL